MAVGRRLAVVVAAVGPAPRRETPATGSVLTLSKFKLEKDKDHVSAHTELDSLSLPKKDL